MRFAQWIGLDYLLKEQLNYLRAGKALGLDGTGTPGNKVTHSAIF